MPRPSSFLPPAPLHLIRLAQGSPGDWVILPTPHSGVMGRVIQLPPRLVAQPFRGWLLCLKGEAVIDLPDGHFVRLLMGEGLLLEAQWDALPTQAGTVLGLFG